MGNIKRDSRVAREAALSPSILRAKRKKLLEAFDIYKANLTYGIDQETPAEHQAIIAWYRKLLNMENPLEVAEAIKDTPAEITQYL